MSTLIVALGVLLLATLALIGVARIREESRRIDAILEQDRRDRDNADYLPEDRPWTT